MTSASIWAVPRPIKKLFDTFPLVEYNEAPASANHFDLTKKYELIVKNGDKDESKKSTFTLGVYSVSEYINKPGVLLPNDPICLSCQLIINLRNELSFPSVRDQEGPSTVKSHNFIAVVSYHASPDSQLPIFIEKEDDGKRQKRILNSTTLINDLQMTRTKPIELMKCLAVDSVLYDFWVITVLFELDPETQFSIYGSQQQEQQPSLPGVVNKFILHETLTCILPRFGFNNRQKKITEQIEFNWKSFYYKSKSDEEIKLIVEKSKDLLSSLDACLQENPNGFLMKDSTHPGALDCKLAGVVYNVMKFAPNSQFGRLLSTMHPKLIEHCFQVIDSSL